MRKSAQIKPLNLELQAFSLLHIFIEEMIWSLYINIYKYYKVMMKMKNIFT